LWRLQVFKARNLQTQSEIIILSPTWKARLDSLRRLDRADQLVCPVCEQPVRVKAGRKVRWHFAHKHLHNCPLQRASPELLAARAALYPWLVAQFGEDCVMLEAAPDGIALPRPLDASVQAGERRWGYWIIDRRLKPEARQELLGAFEGGDMAVHWLFVSQMLRPDQDEADCLYLTTTERDFRQASAFDLIGARDVSRPGASLHYLDAEVGRLHTYRSLRLVHSPQLFSGRPVSSPLEQAAADPNDGAFMHPGEAQALDEARRAQAARQALHAQARAVFRQGGGAASRRPVPPIPAPPSAGGDPPPPAPGPPPAHQLGELEAACMFCGQLTSDWWYLDRKTGRCKCRECLRLGKA
jgi:hypothetical protein